MKIRIVIIAFLATGSICLQLKSASSLQNEIAASDSAEGYESPAVANARYAQYKASMSQIATNIANKDYESLGSNVTAAYNANPDLVLENLFNGGPLSLANLKAAGFTTSQIQDLGMDAGLNSSEAFLYANQGLSADSNYDNIVDMYFNGVNASDITQVTNALKLLNSGDYANDPFIVSYKQELTNPLSSLNEQLTAAKFTPTQIQQICNAAGIDATTTNQIYQLNSFFDQSLDNLSSLISSGNATGASELILSMAAAKPNLTAELFQNGEPLDKDFLSAIFPNEADLTSILKSAGLQTTDIANYLAGKYTGPSVPSGPTGPTGPIEPKNGDTLYDEIYQESLEAYKGLTIADATSLEATYTAQAATIKAEMATVEANSAEYEQYQQELDTANARAQAAKDYVADGGDVPVDPVA